MMTTTIQDGTSLETADAQEAVKTVVEAEIEIHVPGGTTLATEIAGLETNLPSPENESGRTVGTDMLAKSPKMCLER